MLVGAAVTAGAAGFPMVNFGQYRLFAQTQRTYSKRAVDLVRSSLVIDMLGPLKIDMDEFSKKPLSEKDAAEFRASGINAFHHAVGSGGPNAYENALAFFATWNNFVAVNSHVFSGVSRVSDMVRAKAENKCAVIMGLQNSEHFRRPQDVQAFYDLGQRCSQLTYNSQNRIGSGSTDRVDGGVSDFGVAIIKAMNEAGMLVDVSHSGDRTTLDAIELSPVPIAFTHSNCRALVDHPRVKTDEAIIALAKKGGVMGITGVRMFISKKEPTTIVDMVDHIDHVVKLVGIDHVGVGSDADLNGYDDMSPEMQKMIRAAYKDSYAFRDKIDTDGFDHPKKIFDLTEELIRRKYSDANIKAVLGGNFQRLLGSTWK
ncbi:dipeptidase [Sphingosinicella rhizophila]|uniref:Membrane dipeptidase n=1 Tax=Sphingosinicella rhizophila TaxID=3050082 RepID=A0ABU3Q4J1_9SPHN|nr:membrane dipeptidase [Sphingosinicella sp. GR2756]MDT9598202.1 membrane dipeptidase [Sphingosinicella sp. GR2756]